MADQVNAAGVLAIVPGVVPAGAGFGVERKLRVKRARREAIAPQLFTGCVSDISSDAAPAHFHADAFKRYAQVYAAYQAYLMPTDPLAAHDYELGSRAVALDCRLGCLGEDLVNDTVPRDDISDEDIERCGYLGWLHH